MPTPECQSTCKAVLNAVRARVGTAVPATATLQEDSYFHLTYLDQLYSYSGCCAWNSITAVVLADNQKGN